MTTADIIQYYANLLIIQYAGKTKASATIKALVDPVVMDQLPALVQAAYSLDSAVGVQLDVLGKYAGISRNGYDFNGPIVLSDTDYRVIIKIKIIQNFSGSSLADIQNLLKIFFPSTLLVFDYKNMHMSYMLDTSAASVTIAEFLVKQGLLPKPMGVQLSALIYANHIDNFFGFRTYDLPGHNIAPFNAYSSYAMDAPWLSYTNAVI